MATNRGTRSSYFLLLRPRLTLEPVDPFVGERINRNGGREEGSMSMERPGKSDWIGRMSRRHADRGQHDPEFTRQVTADFLM